VDALRQAGQPVVAATTNPAAAAPSVYLDFGRPETYPAAFAGVRRLFLMRPPAIADVQRYLFPVIDFAARAGVEQIVFLSVMGVNPLVPHYQVEQKLKRSGLGYTLLRPSFFMQNLDTTHQAEIRDRDEIAVPVGAGRTSFIDVRDIGAAAARVLSEPGHAGQANTLTGNEAFTYTQVAAVFSTELGRTIRYTNPSPWAFARVRRAQGDSAVLVMVMVALYLTVRLGLGAQVTPTLEGLVGRPPITLEQYVRDYAAAWQPRAALTPAVTWPSPQAI
jgi:uncharacterized protein YbjT (DUF2867 family)